MKFKGTWLFSLIVIFIVGLAIIDYKKQEMTEKTQELQKQILPGFELNKYKTIEFANILGSFTLQKENGVWRMTAPVKDVVDSSELQSFTNGLAEQEASPLDLEGQATIDWKTYGLERPEATLKLTADDGAETTIQFGTERTVDESYYLRMNMANELKVGGRSLGGYLAKQANDLRGKDLYKGSGDFVGLSILAKNGNLKFKKTTSQWQLESQPKLNISDSAISDYLNQLRHLKADSIVAEKGNKESQKKYDLLKPKLVIQLREPAGDDKKAKEWLIKFSEPKNNDVYVFVGEDRPIYKVQNPTLNSLSKDLNYFKDKIYPFSFDHINISGIRLKKYSDGAVKSYYKKQGAWIPEIEEPHSQFMSDKVDMFLNELRGLKVDSYLSGSEAKSALKTGGQFQALNALGETLYEFKWTNPHSVSGKDYYTGSSSKSEGNFLIEKSLVDKIEAISFSKTEVTPASGHGEGSGNGAGDGTKDKK